MKKNIRCGSCPNDLIGFKTRELFETHAKKKHPGVNFISPKELAARQKGEKKHLQLACTCIPLPPRPTSMDYNERYNAILKCPIHSKVPDRETRRYEAGCAWRMNNIRWQKGLIYTQVFAVMQAVGRKQVGVKAFDTPSGWRAISTFPTKEDARAYLLDVLDTVKREQRMGLRTKRNLDPKFEGGLDFRILSAYIVVARQPLLARGWDLSTAAALRPAAKRGRIKTKVDKKSRRKT